MRNKYFLFYCSYPYKNTEASLEFKEQHSQREPRPIPFQSGLEAKQTSLPLWIRLYYLLSLRFNYTLYPHSFLSFKYMLPKLSFLRPLKEESKRKKKFSQINSCLQKCYKYFYLASELTRNIVGSKRQRCSLPYTCSYIILTL